MLPGPLNLNALSLKHAIPSCGSHVLAVASLGDEVFVARSDSQKVDVYDAGTLSLQRSITVPGLGTQPYGLTACISNSCLYVSDYDNHSIHRAELAGDKVTKWYVASHPAGLSVNKAHNLVVVCCEESKLQEYRTNGSLVREICLDVGVMIPWHAVQLSSGDYVVSECTSPGVVSVVGVNGQIRQTTHGLSQISAVGPMEHPRGLAVTKNDEILVADEDNHRILSLTSSLNSIQELALRVDDGMHEPWYDEDGTPWYDDWIQQPLCLCLDESRGRICVGEFAGGRVLVFGDV